MRKILCVLAAVTTSLHLHGENPAGSEEESPRILNERGTEHFFAGRISESLKDWDRVVELVPQQAPHHWQRGIALYYAGRFKEGIAQFEIHQTVNGRDVENAVWHFICAVKAEGGSIEKARKSMYPYAGDRRIPLKEVHALFKGTGSAEEVLAAATESKADKVGLRNNLCYAHLYLGLYYEALDESEKAAHHMRKAAIDYQMDHYMGKVAQIHHALLQKGPKEKKAS